MLNLKNNVVYLACGATDMRKQINGLASIVENSFEINPYESSLFVFCNRRRNRLKILQWDKDGFWLAFKRLEVGKFRWPSASCEDEVIELSAGELVTLIGQTNIERQFLRKPIL